MEQVLQQFCLDGTPVSCEPFGNGHINRTFRVTCSSGRVYTLQRTTHVLSGQSAQIPLCGVLSKKEPPSALGTAEGGFFAMK